MTKILKFNHYNKNNKFTIGVFLWFFISFLSVQCSRYVIPNIEKDKIQSQYSIEIKKNLGVAILFPYRINNLDYFTYRELVSQVKDGFLTLENNEKIISENIEWIDTILDNSPYDFSQDYRNSPKKNILEIQVEFELSRRNPTFWINFISMGIVPSITNYNVILKSFFHDSFGNKSELLFSEKILMNQIRSWLLYPFGFIENDSAYKMLQFFILNHIKNSYRKIDELNLPHNYFERLAEPKNIPFRMEINNFYCGTDLERFQRNDYRFKPIYNRDKYQLCLASLGFMNYSSSIIYLQSKDFSIFSNGKKFPGLLDIEITSTNKISKKREYGLKETFNLNQRMRLDPKDSSFAVFEIYFFITHEETKNLEFIRWENKEISENPSEVWIGWDDSQD